MSGHVNKKRRFVPPVQLLNIPEGFIGDPFRNNTGSIEQMILSQPRPAAKCFRMSWAQMNLHVVFQALHRTQKHRRLTHRVAEDVATVFGHASEEGANAVARIIDHYCSARLAFNRQNRLADLYHNRKLIHILVDEEIRYRYILGTNEQIIYPHLSQHQAKKCYVAETKSLIQNSFPSLLNNQLPDVARPHHSYRNKHFGVLKNIDQTKDLQPMRTMEPPVRYENLPKINPAKYSLTNFIKEQEARKEAEKKAESAAAAHIEQDDAAVTATTAESASAASKDDAGGEEPTPMDISADHADPHPTDVPVLVSAANWSKVQHDTEEQPQATKNEREIEEALADERRRFQEKISELERKISEHENANAELTRGFTETREERDLLAEENATLRREKEESRIQADATQALVDQQQDKIRAAQAQATLNEQGLGVARNIIDNLDRGLRAANQLVAERDEDIQAGVQFPAERVQEIEAAEQAGAQRERMNQELLDSNQELLDLNQQLVAQNEELTVDVARGKRKIQELETDVGRLRYDNQDLNADRLVMERQHAVALRRVEELEEEKHREEDAFIDEARRMMADHHARRVQQEAEKQRVREEQEAAARHEEDRKLEAAQALMIMRYGNRG